jgi:ankyrin repeat protein
MTKIINYQFQYLCKNGDLEKIKQFYFNNPTTINISANSYYAFLISCDYGHLYVVKWLLKNVVKWLLEMKPDIDISANDEYAFQTACCYGHLKVVKWLLKVKPNINISVEYEFAFHDACDFEHLKVAKLLLQHKTQNYYIFAKKKNEIYNRKNYNKNQKIAKQI